MISRNRTDDLLAGVVDILVALGALEDNLPHNPFSLTCLYRTSRSSVPHAPADMQVQAGAVPVCKDLWVAWTN